MTHSSPLAFQVLGEDFFKSLEDTTREATTFHRSSQQYIKGYSDACNDILVMLQQGLGSGLSSGVESDRQGMSISTLLDWIQSRMEAIKVTGKDEEEETDGEEEKNEWVWERGSTSSSESSASATSSTSANLIGQQNPPPLTDLHEPSNRSLTFKRSTFTDKTSHVPLLESHIAPTPTTSVPMLVQGGTFYFYGESCMAQMSSTTAKDSPTRVPIVVNGGTFHFYGGSSILKTTWSAGVTPSVSEEDILPQDHLEPCDTDYHDYGSET